MKKYIGVYGYGHDSNKTITNVNGDSVESNIHIEYERLWRHKRVQYRDIELLVQIAEEDKKTQYNMAISTAYQYEIILNRGTFSGEKYSYINSDEIINRKLTDNYSIIHPSTGHKMMFVCHHLGHAAYAYYTRPDWMEDTDVLTYDAKGLETDSTFYNNTTLVSNSVIGLGWVWDFNSRLLYEDAYCEGKLMGLSSYGKYVEEIVPFFLEVMDKYKTYEQSPLINKEKKWPNKEEFEANVIEYVGKMHGKFKKEDIAHTLQKFSEDFVLNHLRKFKKSDNLCIAGGIGLNGYINQLIVESGLYKNVHVPPACSDSGISFGANLFAVNKDVKWRPEEIRYIGNEYIHEDDKKYHMEYEDLYPYIAKKITEGNIVGWYQGRSESGPRALGNRSILCDPRDPKMKDYLNDRVKHREWYRPFAPAIMKEHVEEWFEGITEAPNMLKICRYKEGMGEKVPSVCHEDYTGRLQTVTEKSNTHFYNLIKAFKDETGVPILLNTSFNDNGEPIVDSPVDAMKTFKNTNIDILVINNYVYRKKK